jgi:membrane associated rhomboid family serine protease
MFLLPLSHESGEVQRTPYVTIGILATCVFLLVVTYLVAPASQEALQKEYERLFSYYSTHPYLEMPEEVMSRLPAKARQTLKQLESIGGLGNLPERGEAEEIIEEQAELDRRVEDFLDAYDDEFYRKYGYIPAEGGILTIISSMFLHGGFFHLLFNMLFLWLTGGVLEDIWGRVVFPIFYLMGGAVATLMHAAIYPASPIPLVGASGAIAALMGAFLIRFHSTRIYFYYFLFFGFRIKQGTFHAPAYFMLPLWLLQQLFEAYKMSHLSPEGGGVAVWAHIGGFIFGAIVALVIKYSGFEDKVLAPAIERKTNLVDENYAEGSRKLREGDINGAIMDLRKSILKDPENAVVHGDLCRAYFEAGKDRAANIEFKRTIRLFLEQSLDDNAVEEFVEISERYPHARLEVDRHNAIAGALVGEERHDEAALAYRRLFDRYGEEEDPPSADLAADALMRHADLCIDFLDRPEDAAAAYTTLLKTFPDLPADQLKAAGKRLKEAKAQIARKRAKAAAKPLKGKPTKTAKPAPAKPPEARPPAIPLAKRFRPLPSTNGPPRYQVASVAPRQANKTVALDDGINLNIINVPPVTYDRIYAIFVLGLEPEGGRRLHADLFVANEQRPFRISSDTVVFSSFIAKPGTNSLENFRQTLIRIISRIDSVFVDPPTMTFLKSGKVKVFPNQDEVQDYERPFWRRLMGEVRCRCGECHEVYWIDGRKVPDGGARSKCKKCGSAMRVCAPPAAG